MTRNFYGTVVSALLIGLAFTACGGTTSTNLIITPDDGGTVIPDAGPGVAVVVAPATTLLQTGLTAGFTATVTGATDTTVTWSVAEASGGTVSSSGQYTAPNTAGTYHVVASAHADETKKGAATVTVAAPGVALVPPTALVVTGTTMTFSATVIGGSGGVTWKVQEAGGGTIDASGKYTPPTTEGTYHFVATSVNDSSKTAVGVATVIKPGHWVNVTPPSVALNGDFVVSGGQEFNYGAQEVVADPNTPGTFLVQITYQGVWRTRDYGATWARLGNGGGPMDTGRAALAIAPDGSYIISTLLYPIGTFSNGAWISLAPSTVGSKGDLGDQANWTRVSIPGVPDDDMGVFHIDPADKTHVFGQPHTPTGFFYESNDSGQTWTPHAMPANDNIAKLNLINSTTVVATYNFGDTGNPQLGKKSGSTWTWTEVVTKDESGKVVSGQQAYHGSQQIFVDAANGNAIYLGGSAAVTRSVDGGANWTKLNTPHDSEGIVATPTTLYSTHAFAGTTGFNGSSNFQHAPRGTANTGAGWVDDNSAAVVPASMNNGWLGAAVAQDTSSTKWVIVAGCWDAGIFIYVEP
jgi:hypothetical protein